MTFTEWFAKKGRHSHNVSYQDVWDAAQLAEREACAKIADSGKVSALQTIVDTIADNIRARSDKEKLKC